MTDKTALDFLEIRKRIKQCKLPEVDLVIGIGSGGIVPAALVAYELERPFFVLSINYRAPDNSPRYEQPQLISGISLTETGQRLLLVDDVSVSGKTMEIAMQALAGHHVTTMVMKGQADIVLFPDVATCVRWPWSAGV